MRCAEDIFTKRLTAWRRPAPRQKGVPVMDLKLEVVVVPVSDVDKAKQFYETGLACRLDADVSGGDDYRLVQLTPPGSPCSIIFGKGVTSDQPGSIDSLVLAVDDIDAARDELLSRGVEVSDVFHDAGGSLGGGFHPGTEGRATGPDPQGRSYGSYASFSDPDGNGWLLQEITERLPGRV
jgi:catechol 2,3-dioxygenase-like lactoylglutathione lyase family enzyme